MTFHDLSPAENADPVMPADPPDSESERSPEPLEGGTIAHSQE